MKRAFGLVLLLAPAALRAQVQPGSTYFLPHIGPIFPRSELLRNVAIYSTPRPTDPTNPVVTDIKVDPGMFVGGRWVYGLTQRLAVEAELDFSLAILAIRQLEFRPDDEEGDLPQYETTTFDARTYQMGVNLVYFLGTWGRALPFLTAGVGTHSLDLRRKGEVDPDPVRDRMFMAGMGVMIQATERLGFRIEARDFMYNFRFDNQFADPAVAPLVLFRRPDFYNTTSIAADKFQNDVAVTLGFMVRPF